MKNTNKRKLIIDSALILFIDNGYHNTKIIDIANNAGIGKGTVYEYFSSKKEILLEVIKDLFNNNFANLLNILDSKKSASDKLESLYNFVLNRSNTSYILQLLHLSFKEIHDESVHTIVHHFVQEQYNLTKSIIKEGIDQNEFINLDENIISVIINGSIEQYNMYNNILDIDIDNLSSKDFFDHLLSLIKK